MEHTSKLNTLDIDRRIGFDRFRFPDEINQVLRRVNELRFHFTKLRVEKSRFFMRYHTSVNAYPWRSSVSLWGYQKRKYINANATSYHDPFNPILGFPRIADLDQCPVCINFLLSLKPVPRISEQKSGMHGDYGLSSCSREARDGIRMMLIYEMKGFLNWWNELAQI